MMVPAANFSVRTYDDCEEVSLLIRSEVVSLLVDCWRDVVGEEADCPNDTDELTDEIVLVWNSGVETATSDRVCKDAAGVISEGSSGSEFVKMSNIPAIVIRHSNKINAFRSPLEK